MRPFFHVDPMLDQSLMTTLSICEKVLMHTYGRE